MEKCTKYHVGQRPKYTCTKAGAFAQRGPDTQKRKFNIEHNVTTFDYAIIYSNLDAVTARLLEYSLIAHYTIFVNYGKLPHKHELPSFVKDRPWDLIGTGNDRVIRARKFIQEQIAKYGK